MNAESLERVILENNPNIPNAVIREHLLRYVFAMESISGKDVLDLACGSGYGMFLMSFLANSVSGYDYSTDAISEAQKFPYKCDACLEIRNLEEDNSLKNHKHDSFDVVTCFETIEHVKNPEVLAKNIKDAISPGGVAYISTPNDLKRTDNNEWHKVHFDFYSLFHFLKDIFGDVDIKLYGQDQWGITTEVAKPYVIAKIQV
jgi:2-polyprenyl-3-methyl-5-hydroxy-6-metoxy-1,4-benzoquinol methylase